MTTIAQPAPTQTLAPFTSNGGSGGGSGLSGGAIAGIVIGVVCGIVATIVLYVVIRVTRAHKRREVRRKRIEEQRERDVESGGDARSSFSWPREKDEALEETGEAKGHGAYGVSSGPIESTKSNESSSSSDATTPDAK